MTSDNFQATNIKLNCENSCPKQSSTVLSTGAVVCTKTVDTPSIIRVLPLLLTVHKTRCRQFAFLGKTAPRREPFVSQISPTNNKRLISYNFYKK
jgi:hypothetical protein